MKIGTVVRRKSFRDYVGVYLGVEERDSRGRFRFRWIDTHPDASFKHAWTFAVDDADVELVDEGEATLLLLAYPKLSDYGE